MTAYRVCGESLRGKSHAKNNSVCQDSFYAIERADCVIAAVADGLGSSKHSDIASRMAAKGAAEYCGSVVVPGMAERDIISCINRAFGKVNFDIKHKAGEFLDDYDTTLTLAVYIAGTLYYGHAGDSGIIALRSDGIFEEVTTPQLGDGIGKERPVYPLAAESHWLFAKYNHRARAVFMMTDGMLNKAIPPLLEDQEYKLDNAYLFYLYDSLCKHPDRHGWVNTELLAILPQEVNYDDMTLLAIMSSSVKLKLQPKAYYRFPSEGLWSALMAAHKSRLYGYKSNQFTQVGSDLANQPSPGADLANQPSPGADPATRQSPGASVLPGSNG